jgi:uncharacterized membrane protein
MHPVSMTQRLILPLALAFVLPLAACQQGASDEPAAPESPAATAEPAPVPASASFTEDAKIQFTGTEPFWGGSVEGTSLIYTTPENIDGTTIAVERSAVHGVLNLTGTLAGGAFEMVIKEGECSDGMSDRTYPLIAALSVDGEERTGCAWSAEHPYEGPVNP